MHLVLAAYTLLLRACLPQSARAVATEEAKERGGQATTRAVKVVAAEKRAGEASGQSSPGSSCFVYHYFDLLFPFCLSHLSIFYILSW